MAKILIVDDIADNLQLLSFELEDEGYEVYTAQNGEQCLKAIEQHQPDLVLLDLFMPIMNGIQTLKQIRANPAYTDIPVIMVSANEDTKDIVEALDLGAHDYVSKPFVYPILAARVRSALRLRESQLKLEDTNQQLKTLAAQDPLTGAFNRRHFFELANAEFARSKRYDRPMCLLMIDIDHFKRINDQYGHASGDKVLTEISNLCQEYKRESDIFARFGGEEFVLCCSDTAVEGGMVFAERLRHTVANTPFMGHDGKPIHLTLSLGLTAALPEDNNIEETLQRADRFLYLAKESGRNRLMSDLDIQKQTKRTQ